VGTAFDLVVLGIRDECREATTGVGRRSGSAVLNLRTGGICGVMKRSRDPESSEGGRASPTNAIAACWHDDKAQSFSIFGQENWPVRGVS
jgi:hypothetical protein